MNSVNSRVKAAKDTMIPAALRRKMESPAGKKDNRAGLEALTKEDAPVATQSIVANTGPVVVADTKAAAPQRPPPRPADAGSVPQLNRYVRAQLPKGEVGFLQMQLSACRVDYWPDHHLTHGFACRAAHIMS